MALTLLTAGPALLPVDGGRRGVRALGVPPGGAADVASLALANALVGNDPDAPALEFALMGPALRAEVPLRLAVVGAPFTVRVDGTAVPAGSAFSVPAGGLVRIGGTPTRVRGTLAVAGGFAWPRVMGSVQPFDPLTDGATLPCRPGRQGPAVTLPFAALDDSTNVLRVLPGPQFDWFSDPDSLTCQTFRVAATSNRMGVRLECEHPLTRRPGELESEPVDVGAVQVTNDGRPVLLGVDGPTIGGYPKVAHVIAADRDLMGQLRPGDGVGFQWVAPDEACRALAARRGRLREWCLRARLAGG